MPHQCTSCERTFADGSKQMLSGCPDCGGNTFQYLPDEGAAPAGDPDPPDRAGGSGVAGTVGRAATTLRDVVTPDSDAPSDRAFSATPREDDTPATPPSRADHEGPPDDSATADRQTAAEGAPRPETSPDTVEERRDAEFIDADADGEDTAQSSARSEVLDDGAFPGGVVGSGGSASDRSEPTSDPQTPTADARATSDRGSLPTVDPQPSAPEDGTRTGGADGPQGSPATDETATGGAAPTPDPADAPEETPATGPAGAPPATDADGRVVGTPEGDRPDLSDLREELNAQFEGIRVTEPGQYELNLMELYEREETIIALKEDGRYVIEVPEAWHGDDD